MIDHIPPEHGEPAGPPPMPRCPECAVVIDTYLAAGTGNSGKGRCPTHGLVTPTYGDRDAIKAAAYDKAKHEPYEIGAAVEVEFPDAVWVAGQVEGYSHDDVDVVRIDVRLADGRFARAAHPQHVRAVAVVEFLQGDEARWDLTNDELESDARL